MIKNAVKILLSAPVLLPVAAHRLKLLGFDTAGEMLAFIPGGLGRLWRRAWYRLTLDHCGRDLCVDWMAVIRTPRARVGDNVYIGVFCWIGWADIGDDVMLGGHVTVLSGSRHHSFDRTDVPMSRQGGHPACVRVGQDVWIGNRAVVMADVAEGSVVGAGSVVTKPHEPRTVLAGAPARPLRRREGAS